MRPLPGLAFFSPRPASGCLLKAEFLAIALVLVYVGAVMVLFLFVVMMLDIKGQPCAELLVALLPLAACGGRADRAGDGLVLKGGFQPEPEAPDCGEDAGWLDATGCWASDLFRALCVPALRSPP